MRDQEKGIGPPGVWMAVVITVVLLLPVRGAEAQGVCVFYEPPHDSDWVVKEEEVRVLGTVLGERTRVQRREPHMHRHLTATFNELRIEDAIGRGAEKLVAGGEILVVRWTGPRCHPFPGPSPILGAPFPAGSKQVVTGVLRDEGKWVDGLPTLDLGPASAHLIPGRSGDAPPMDLVWELLTAVLPGPEEWYEDCRPVLRRVRAWWGGIGGLGGLNHVAEELQDPCARMVADRGESMILYPSDSPDIPVAILEFMRSEGCSDLSTPWHAVFGGFRTERGEWALICPGAQDWRLIVVSKSDTSRSEVLLRRTGSPRRFLLASAPPEYFDWMTAPEFESGRMQRPASELLLLFAPNGRRGRVRYEIPELVYFHTGSGWETVQPDCCRGIGGFPR